MTWTRLRGALYTQGATLYRISPADGRFLLDAWSVTYGGWAYLAQSDSLDVAKQFAECEEVYQQMEVA